MRLFVALAIPAEVRARIVSLIDELRPLAPGLKWVRADNMHVTLKFIGETYSGKLKTIQAALATEERRAIFDLKFQGLGFFPNEKRPCVLWIGIHAPPAMGHLASEIETALAGAGFPRETRSFSPHLTMARLEGGHLPTPLRSAIEQSASQEFGLMRVTEFHLIESKLKSSGAEYTTVQTFQFVSER